jgi:hypothetical protein
MYDPILWAAMPQNDPTSLYRAMPDKPVFPPANCIKLGFHLNSESINSFIFKKNC